MTRLAYRATRRTLSRQRADFRSASPARVDLSKTLEYHAPARLHEELQESPHRARSACSCRASNMPNHYQTVQGT
jgi:hypothetical protein